MKPAISTLIIYKNKEKKLQKLVENNPKIQNWEIVDEGFHELNGKTIKQLKNLASINGLNFAVHAPFSSINLAEANQILREKFVWFMKKSLKKAYKLEARIWIVHPGRLTPFTYFFPEKAWEAQISSLNILAKEANLTGINLVVENMIGDFTLFKSVKDGLKILENSENVGICLDVGHANLTKNLDNFLRKISKIQHIHVHDNNGFEDEHLPAGEGTVNWKKLQKWFKTTNYNGWVVAENYKLNHSLKTLKFLGLI